MMAFFRIRMLNSISATALAPAVVSLTLFLIAPCLCIAQSRIGFNGQQLFLNGSNVAWVNFASDLGPSPPDTVRFKAAFDSIHAHGGNAMRLWLHTTGTYTPQFGTDGRVIGPGTNAIANLQRILDLAWQRRIGLLLCLWSFDMLDKSNPAVVVNRADLMLTDTSYTKSYITNSLIPMVGAVKGHPAIIGWEVFNEAEGMSNEFGWSTTYHVPMANIQRFVNLVAGAIHRTDSTARVTTGAWALTAETDVVLAAKITDVQSQLDALTPEGQQKMEQAFAARYGFSVTAKELIERFFAAGNYNYYRDDRLIASGGDPQGTLDFYTDHYYDWQGTSISPFHHPYSSWQLTKPLVIAEFFPETTLSIPYTDLYRILYDNGYAGALSWGWYSGATGHPQSTLQANTLVLTQDMFSLHPFDVDDNPIPGRVYSFSAQPPVIDSGDVSVLTWQTALGTTARLNDSSVSNAGSLSVFPLTTTMYRLTTGTTILDTVDVTINVNPSGRILSFTASATRIAVGDPCLLRWTTSRGSHTALNGVPVNTSDSMMVHPDSTTTYMLTAVGSARDTSRVTVVALPIDQFDRALYRPLDVSSNSSNPQFSDPHALVDGDSTTQWASLSSNYQWIDCDLGQRIQITRVLVRWGGNYATDWRISLSNDHAVWNLARTISGGIGGDEVVDSIGQVAQFIELLLDKRWQDTVGFKMREFEVYGLVESSSVSNGPTLPKHFALLQNFPNPFNPSTTIMFALPFRSTVSLSIFNTLGQRVTEIANGVWDPGNHTVVWNGAAAAGVYFCRMVAMPVSAPDQTFQQTIKLVLLR